MNPSILVLSLFYPIPIFPRLITRLLSSFMDAYYTVKNILPEVICCLQTYVKDAAARNVLLLNLEELPGIKRGGGGGGGGGGNSYH